jgi:hypothetical protein
MPKWATLSSFVLLMKHIKGEPFGDVDVKTSQRLLWLADFLKIGELEEICIKQLIIPRLNKDNVLVFLEDSFAKISSSTGADENVDIDDVWNLLLTECLDTAAQHIHYLVRAVRPVLVRQEEVVIDELLDRAFKIFMVNLNTDNGQVIELLMQVKKANSPFELLENERLKVSEREKQYFTSGEAAPTLTWNVSGLKGNFYRESEPFFVLNCYWVLSISSFKPQGTLSIAIKQSKSPKEVEEQLNASYYNKNQYFLKPSKKRPPNSSKASPEKKSAEVSSEGKIPNHCLLTIASFVRIKEYEDVGEGTFQLASLISASKSPTVLRVMEAEDLQAQNGSLSIEIYLKLEYTYSGILTYISRNFNWLYNHPNVGKLTKNQFFILLKHKYLNVKREEDVLIALCMWSKRGLDP